MKRASFVALLALGLAACGGNGIANVDGELQLSPDALDFGTRPVLNDETLKVHVINVGRAPVKITRTVTGDAVFTLTSGPTELEGGAEGDFAVLFEPAEEKSYSGKLVLDTDETNVKHHEIPLQGVGSTVAAVEVTPPALDFGVVGENRVAFQPVTITSTGTADLIIDFLGVKAGSNPAYAIQGSTHTPVTIPAQVPGQPASSIQVNIAFAPTAATVGTDTSGTLEIKTTDPNNRTIDIPMTAAVNQQPVAVPGDDRMVAPGTLLSLDGTHSYDPDGTIAKYEWTLTKSPQGSNPDPQALDSATPTFTADQPGEYDFDLVVTDDQGLDSKAAHVAVTAVTSDKLVIELLWDHPVADLDLHFLRPGDALDGPADCDWSNPHPDWGVAGDPSDDPANLGDKLAGFGPEYVVYEAPPDGAYEMAVKYVSANGAAQTHVNATIRVYLYGVVVRELDHQMADAGETWDAGTVTWPTGEVTTSAAGSAP